VEKGRYKKKKKKKKKNDDEKGMAAVFGYCIAICVFCDDRTFTIV
jgi:hypothetical protein